MKLCRSERSTKTISLNDSTRQMYLIANTTTCYHLKRSRLVVYSWRYCWSCHVPFVGGKFCRGSALSIHSHQRSASSAEFCCNHDSKSLCHFYKCILLTISCCFVTRNFFSFPYKQMASLRSRPWLVSSTQYVEFVDICIRNTHLLVPKGH